MNDRERIEAAARGANWLVSAPDSYGDIWYGLQDDYVRATYRLDGKLIRAIRPGGEPFRGIDVAEQVIRYITNRLERKPWRARQQDIR